jgi:uncharacterized protein YutE (UPF0331/DUF86 family)
MVDQDLVLKKLAFIETYVQQLHDLARLDDIDTDVREERFVVHTLQLAAQAALDVASHIVSDHKLGEPATNRELFDLLHAAGWITPDCAKVMGRLAGFRNLVVHGYERVNLGIVKDVVCHRLTDLLAYCAAIRTASGRTQSL